jgi:hypothetical protein
MQRRSFTERLDDRGERRHDAHRRTRSCASAAKARVYHHPGLHLLRPRILPRQRPRGHRRCATITVHALRQIHAEEGWR